MSKKARLKAELEAEKNQIQSRLRKAAIGTIVGVLVLSFTVGVLAQFNMLPSTSVSFFSPAPVPVPSPTPTPPALSKEYIYAGGRMLATEDVGAQQQSATDLAVFRQSDGSWWILNGITGTTSGNYWGTSGDKAIPADFDGDGTADIAIFRPSTGVWYVTRSSDGWNKARTRNFVFSTRTSSYHFRNGLFV